jgi:hypothetical protein
VELKIRKENNMEIARLSKGLGVCLVACSLTVGFSGLVAAQETSQQPPAQPSEKMGAHGVGHGHMHGAGAEMQHMHERMEKMHEEMTQELQKQLVALREHAKAMEGISDEKQLLREMRKHQLMTDGLLGAMVEQREKMHAQMQAHHRQMHGGSEESAQPESKGAAQSSTPPADQ